MPLPEARFNHLTIQLAGRNWAGEWRLIGKEVCVSSAYGSLRKPVGRRTPEKVAGEALGELVRTWREA